jgi:hypothetical protein
MEGQPHDEGQCETGGAPPPVVAAAAAAPVVALADGLTPEDVDEVLQSVTTKALKAKGYTGNQIRVDPREEYVLVRAWRTISAHLAPIRLAWQMDNGKNYIVLTNPPCASPNLELGSLVLYEEAAAASTQLAANPTESLLTRLNAKQYASDIRAMVRSIRSMQAFAQYHGSANMKVYSTDKCALPHIAHISRTFFEPQGYRPLEWDSDRAIVRFTSNRPSAQTQKRKNECCMQ